MQASSPTSIRASLPVTVPLPRAPSIFGISRRSIYRAADMGKITLLKAGRTTLVDTESALAFLDGLPRRAVKAIS